jgi:energy-coupling factor transporter ATP-binding protein EcfA2
MRIQQISVTGLFGIFNHVIPLNMNDRITIVHGPNGFGKTAMLRLLNGFFNSEYSIFETIPFNSFQILFNNDSYVDVLKVLDESEKIKVNEEIIFNFCNINLQRETFSPLRQVENAGISSLSKVIFSLKEIDEILDGKTPLKAKAKEEPKWLLEIKSYVHIRLIESQRLLNIAHADNPKINVLNNNQRSSMLPTVSAYSDEIAQIMRDKFSEYGVISQSLDRTFPNRLVQRQSSPNLTEEQLRDRLEQLEVTRSRLIESGLLDETENPDFPVQPPAIDESTKNILSVYVEDVEKKLSVFNDVASKIDLLRKIINSKFAYSYKEMSFNKEKGFVFKTFYNSSVSHSDTLSPTDLSSGEQHELVLLYELLFKVEPKSLVLIDEPELSLHVGWQVQFLKDLQDIVKLADLDILMATHSPDIIQDRWDLTVELKGQEK